LTAIKNRLTAATKTIELADLPQRASDVDTLVTDAATSTRDEDALPLRELLGLDEALQRTRGALVDNLAKLSRLTPTSPKPNTNSPVKKQPMTP